MEQQVAEFFLQRRRLFAVDGATNSSTVTISFSNLPADVPTIAVPNVLLVREDFAFGNACAITKLIYDKRADLEKVHPAAKKIEKDKAQDTAPVPMHPGSVKALEGS